MAQVRVDATKALPVVRDRLAEIVEIIIGVKETTVVCERRILRRHKATKLLLARRARCSARRCRCRSLLRRPIRLLVVVMGRPVRVVVGLEL